MRRKENRVRGCIDAALSQDAGEAADEPNFPPLDTRRDAGAGFAVGCTPRDFRRTRSWQTRAFDPRWREARIAGFVAAQPSLDANLAQGENSPQTSPTGVVKQINTALVAAALTIAAPRTEPWAVQRCERRRGCLAIANRAYNRGLWAGIDFRSVYSHKI